MRTTLSGNAEEEEEDLGKECAPRTEEKTLNNLRQKATFL
jgi:hypothetical protein